MADSGSATIASLNGEVDIPAFGYDTIVCDVQGTFSATLVIEATVDNLTWFSINGISPQTTNIFSAFIQALQITIPCTGYQQVRIRASAYTSGTVTVFFDAIMGDNNIDISIPQGQVNTNPPSYSSGSIAQLSLDTAANLRVLSKVVPASLGVTATGTSGSAVTLTIPAVASQYHYITAIEIVAYTAVARTGTGTPVLVTSTNLPGSNVWDFQSVGVIGSSERQLTTFSCPLKSSVSNTATTIVCPATTSVIWRVNAYYYAAA